MPSLRRARRRSPTQTVAGASWKTLAHEIGHTLGLKDLYLSPRHLMFFATAGGTVLSPGEIVDAQKGLRIRNGRR
jgi:hypothetical protein